MALNELYTPRSETLSGTPWQTYPRPQLRRDSYVNLNGEWEFTASQTFPTVYDRKILVPFCPESQLSGIKQHFPEGIGLYYRRTFQLPEGFCKDRILLHIGAADQHAKVYVNQKEIGSHSGGYWAFTFDITDALQKENELVICCTDDLRSKVQPFGKQTMNRGGMWYTPVSGIWQTVWLESVPENYIHSLDIRTSATGATITVYPVMDGTVIFEGKHYPLSRGSAVITLDEPRLWSPEDPYLYQFTVEAGSDRVESYFALRTLETKVVGGSPRLCLNGKPYFFHGLLDQGYWPDGIYTPAAPECYSDDILAMKRLGFNTLRKHIKIEPEQFYYDCDRLGMIVFQDMVNNGDYSFLRDTILPTVLSEKRQDKNLHKDAATRAAFLSGMEKTVAQLKNHPCIVYWTIFNEGWGQFCSTDAYRRLKDLDSSRFIDATSGWFRCGESDVESLHIYFGLWYKLRYGDKPVMLSEFGGYVYPEPDHIFNPEKAFGYRVCKTKNEFQKALTDLYRSRVLPAVSKGLCGAIYTQVSDVEDEINGLLTYDRKVCKAEEAALLELSRELQKAVSEI